MRAALRIIQDTSRQILAPHIAHHDVLRAQALYVAAGEYKFLGPGQEYFGLRNMNDCVAVSFSAHHPTEGSHAAMVHHNTYLDGSDKALLKAIGEMCQLREAGFAIDPIKMFNLISVATTDSPGDHAAARAQASIRGILDVTASNKLSLFSAYPASIGRHVLVGKNGEVIRVPFLYDKLTDAKVNIESTAPPLNIKTSGVTDGNTTPDKSWAQTIESQKPPIGKSGIPGRGLQ